MKHIFEEDKQGNLTIALQILTIKEFAELAENRGRKGKARLNAELSALWFLVDMRSPYMRMNEEERWEYIKDDVLFAFPDWQTDQYFDACVEKYREMSRTRSMDTLESAWKAQTDYQRKETRKYTFLALMSGLVHIARGLKVNFESYFEIPNNEELYLDRIVKNVRIGKERGDLGVYFKESLINGQIQFKPTLERFGDLAKYGADEIVSGDHLTFSSREDAENWLAIEFI